MISQYIYSALAGLFISLSGSLPLGNLNVTAMYIATKETLKQAMLFALGVAFVEIVYLRITLNAVSWILGHNKFLYYIQWINIVLLLILATGCFLTLRKKKKVVKNILIDNRINRFLLGVIMSAINPVQIPFWAGWTTYLITQYWLAQNTGSYTFFVLAAGAGTLVALFIFILAGRKFSGIMTANRKKVNIITGLLFLTIAVIQLIKLPN